MAETNHKELLVSGCDDLMDGNILTKSFIRLVKENFEKNQSRIEFLLCD
ncbi:MAG: hypothetical protein QW698_01955 [Nitrososphaerales archaeon]